MNLHSSDAEAERLIEGDFNTAYENYKERRPAENDCKTLFETYCFAVGEKHSASE